MLEFLPSAGASVETRYDGGLHLLNKAFYFGYTDAVRLLLDAGLNPNIRDKLSYSPLLEAAIKGNVDLLIDLDF